jgi:hypothetical protein
VRGRTVEFSATISNIGEGAASIISPYWILPEGLELIASDDDCVSLVPGSYCTVTAQVYVKPDITGMKEIRMLVDYV